MENIALGFSGGGFRAACFSLGSLSYLNRLHYRNKPLLENVRYISSTSGGSITNLVYSSFLFKGKDFNACYGFLFTKLDGEDLMRSALDKLGSSREWKKRSLKSRNLINAFSLAYDELLEQEIFGVFSNRAHNPHLEEICITSTEFTNGLPFRFQAQHPDPDFPKGMIGNKFINFTETGVEQAAKLKLADILASSSCFPSGFEPLIFPNDYTHEQLTAKDLRDAISYKANSFTLPVSAGKQGTAALSSEEAQVQEDIRYNTYDLLKDKKFSEEIHFGIMDGGVADNQGIDAFKLADERRDKGKKFDLFMACDVTSFYMDGYTLPMEKKTWFNRITPLAIIVFWVLCSLVLPALLLFNPGTWHWSLYAAATISGLMALPVAWLLMGWIIKKITGKKPGNSVTAIIKKYKGMFLRLRIGAIKQMLASRFKSVLILANDIYLKQMRRMYYRNLFTDERYKNRVIQNTIYDLSRVKFDSEADTQKRRPSPAMTEVAEKARTMGTTLWFDAKHQADKIKECIIATGQFTTCHNLLRYLEKKEEATLTPELKKLKAALTADFQKFCDDPMMMM